MNSRGRRRASRTDLSLVARNRRSMLMGVTVGMIAIAAGLLVTFGVLGGNRAVRDAATVSVADRTGAGHTSLAAGVASSAPAPILTSGKGDAVRATPSATTNRAAAKPSRGGTDRRVSFVNRTSQKIWVAGWQQTAKPALSRSGWVLPAGQSLSILVPDKWNGRFWGRTGCTFNASGTGHCQTGDCAGRFQCRSYGAIPATLAEYNFSAWQGMDFYDVSMVDGSNLPMFINHTGGRTKDAISSTGCSEVGCTSPVPCPKELKVDGGAGCESPCAKLGGQQYCCQGPWAPRTECDPTKWPVNYAAIFKKAEPFAYSYVDDDATSTFTCTGRCDYRITFGLTLGHPRLGSG